MLQMVDPDITGRDPNAKGGRVRFSEGGGKDMGRCLEEAEALKKNFHPKIKRRRRI